jgi:hypothetical protein
MRRITWIILVLTVATGRLFAETADHGVEQLLKMLGNAQADEIRLESAGRRLVLQGNVRWGTHRADGVTCDVGRGFLYIMAHDHDLGTDDRWAIDAFDCGQLIELLRARGRLP